MKKLLTALFFLFLSVASAEAAKACDWRTSGGWCSLYPEELRYPSVSLFAGNPNDGALVLNGKVPEERTALDLWPVDGALPSLHALTETVWYATRFQDWPNFERFNITQMAGGKQVRFGVERGGIGEFREVIFCFEDVTPGVAYCPFKITMQGVYVCDAQAMCNKIGG